jgi:hypothetical protein
MELLDALSASGAERFPVAVSREEAPLLEDRAARTTVRAWRREEDAAPPFFRHGLGPPECSSSRRYPLGQTTIRPSSAATDFFSKSNLRSDES